MIHAHGRKQAKLRWPKTSPDAAKLLARTLPHRVELPGKWRKFTPAFVYPRRCYERTHEFVIWNTAGVTPPAPFSIDDIRLVHGQYSGTDAAVSAMFGHAWVEIGPDVIFDGVLQSFFNAEGYRLSCGAIAEAIYNPQETAMNTIKHGHNGPWHV